MSENADFARRLAAARGGDKDAAGELWHALAPRLRAYVERVIGPELRSGALVDEVLQQTSIDLLTQLPHLPTGLDAERFTGIVLKFARRRSIDACRRDRAHAGRTISLVEDLAARQSSIGDVTMADARRRVRELIDELPATYARILTLCDVQGQSLASAAEQLGIRPVTARKQHSRAVAMLLERTRGLRGE